MNAVSKALSSTLQALAESRLQEILDSASQMAGSNNYPEAKSTVTEGSSRLQQEIRSVLDDSRLISSVTATINQINAALMSAHYQYCKSSFTSRKNTTSTRDVSACLNEARKYLMTWPESLQTREGSEVKQAAEFLEAIQGGVQGQLVISEGYFKAIDRLTDTPDMKIVISIGNDSWETDTIMNSVNPHFDARLNIRWSVDMRTITFRGIEVDDFVDTGEVFSGSIYPGGMKGFEQLTQTLRDNGCTLSVKFNPSSNIPNCPW